MYNADARSLGHLTALHQRVFAYVLKGISIGYLPNIK